MFKNERRRNCCIKKFEEIMFVNSSNLMKDLNLKIQGAQHIQNRKKSQSKNCSDTLISIQTLKRQKEIS